MTKSPSSSNPSSPAPAEDAAPASRGNPFAPRHLRAPIEIRIEITANAQSFTTTSRNIALGGISFESAQEFRCGDWINVLLYIPMKKDLELLKIASEVVWAEEDHGSWLIGAAFRKFAPGDERRLRAWLLESVRAQREGRSI